MTQKTTQLFESPCKQAKIYVDVDMPIGVFHDFLMQMKGLMVDRMIAAHKQQLEEMVAQQRLDLCESNGSCAPKEDIAAAPCEA